jgi:hypothetical protein
LDRRICCPYYELADKGVIIDIAASRRSTTDPKVKRIMQLQRIPKDLTKDTELKAKLKETHKLADVRV